MWSQKQTQLSISINGDGEKLDARLHERETRTCEILHILIWCTSSVRRFFRDRQSDVLKHPIVQHVLCALDSERGVCRPHAYECRGFPFASRFVHARPIGLHPISGEEVVNLLPVLRTYDSTIRYSVVVIS